MTEKTLKVGSNLRRANKVASNIYDMVLSSFNKALSENKVEIFSDDSRKIGETFTVFIQYYNVPKDIIDICVKSNTGREFCKNAIMGEEEDLKYWWDDYMENFYSFDTKIGSLNLFEIPNLEHTIENKDKWESQKWMESRYMPTEDEEKMWE